MLKKLIFILISLFLLGGTAFAYTFPIDIDNCIVKGGRVELTGWYNQKRSYGKHRAIDIPAVQGTTVRAIKTGIVIEKGFEYIKKGKDASYGNYVIIQDVEGNKWLYAHLDSYDVKLNERITEGQKIGEVGWTGLRTPACHLHIEKRNENNVKIIFTKQLGDAIRPDLPNPKVKYTFTLR